MRREMDGGQNNRARVRVARAQIVEKFLAQIVGGVDVQNEEVRPQVDDQLLCFLEAVGDFHLRAGRGFVQSLPHGVREMFIVSEDQDAAGGRGGR